jgi:hypothetical protein
MSKRGIEGRCSLKPLWEIASGQTVTREVSTS